MDGYLKVLFALLIWREARSEGVKGMTAVGCVVRNRVQARWGSWFKCMTAKNQFTSISVKGDPQLTLWPPPTDSQWAEAMSIASRVYDGLETDVTGGALYYENPTTATSAWFANNVRDVRPVTARIGQHVFYA